jgi:hypothetical protein
MAKKPALSALSFRDLVLGAEAETLRQALEARVRIDELVAERLAAYERIAALETQIEDVIGEPGVFPFPAPPLPVAGIDPKSETLARSATAAKKAPARESAPEPTSEDVSAEPETDA